MEAGEIALYMFLICTFATLLMHPASPLRHLIHDGLFRRALMGFLVGSTVIAIIMTPWGKRSGGHFNPAITLTFYRLGKLAFWDAFFYIVAQFAGAAGGVGIAASVLRDAPKSSTVRYAVTVPGLFGDAGAFTGEMTISFVLMTGILFASNREPTARYTPYLVGVLYAMFITVEATTLRHEHESCPNLRFCVWSRLLAGILDLFDCPHTGHAGRSRSLFVG